MRYCLLIIMLFCTESFLAAAPELPLWPGPAPGETGPKLGPERNIDNQGKGRETRRLTDISVPTLTVYAPAKPNGTAIVIAPGGGYNLLAWDLEGLEVAEWLSKQGITAFVLKYRVPRRQGTPPGAAPPQAQMDIQRAVSLVRSKAKDYQLKPEKIGVLGFSAGGHLAAWASTNFTRRSYEPIDDVDQVSCRPDFSILIYPAYLLDRKDPSQLAADLPVSDKTPPAFLVHAYDDNVTPESSVRYFSALKKLKIPAELHIYSSGGHGYGLRDDGKPISSWPRRCEDWLRAQGLIGQ